MEDKNARFAAKWPEGVASRGFTPVPKCLITCAGDLNLKPQEAMVLFNIVERCWKAGEKAWPSVDYLATNIGRRNSATRAITSSLAKKGFLEKEQRYNTSNLYGLEPLANKLAEHMPHCRQSARKPERFRRRSSGQDSRKTSDYIEPGLTRTTTLDTNIIRHHTKGDNELSLNVKYKRATCPATGDNHEWDDFEVERGNSTYYYKRCEYCDMTFSKKDKPPFGEDPTRFLDDSTELYTLPEVLINLDEIDF